MMDLKSYQQVSVKASKAAGSYILKNMGTLREGDIEGKRAFDYVTKVDKGSEEVIREIIKAEFPDHGIYAEEGAKDENNLNRWIIDPLDGTTNYIHGYPHFGVSIAYEHQGTILMGTIYDPLRKEVFTAIWGSGAFLNRKKIRVSENKPNQSLLATGFPFRDKGLIKPYLRVFEDIFQNVSYIRRAGSAVLDLAHLAAGRLDGFFEIGLYPWDLAAGSLIIKEAGGVVSDFAGGQDHVWTGNIIAGNIFVHPLILKKVGLEF